MPQQLSARTWTSTSGDTVEARFVEVASNYVVLDKGSETIRIAVGKLSLPDQAWIREYRKAMSARTWKTKDGRQHFGRFVDFEDGVLQIGRGQEFTDLKYEQLTSADQSALDKIVDMRDANKAPIEGEEGERGGDESIADDGPTQGRGLSADVPQGYELAAEASDPVEMAESRGPLVAARDPQDPAAATFAGTAGSPNMNRPPQHLSPSEEEDEYQTYMLPDQSELSFWVSQDRKPDDWIYLWVDQPASGPMYIRVTPADETGTEDSWVPLRTAADVLAETGFEGDKFSSGAQWGLALKLSAGDYSAELKRADPSQTLILGPLEFDVPVAKPSNVPVAASPPGAPPTTALTAAEPSANHSASSAAPVAKTDPAPTSPPAENYEVENGIPVGCEECERLYSVTAFTPGDRCPHCNGPLIALVDDPSDRRGSGAGRVATRMLVRFCLGLTLAVIGFFVKQMFKS